MLELMVASFIGLLVTGLALSSSIVSKNSWAKDTVRTRLNQSLRGAVDIVGLDVRVAGENLNSAFPAIEIVNGSSGAPDTLIVRRNLLEEVLPLCTTIAAASTVTNIYFATTGTTAGCVYSGQTHNYSSWRSYRIANSGQVRAFLYDTVNKRGEFFDYTGEVDTGTTYRLTRPAGPWQYTYTAGASAVYILEEWRYQLQGGMLQLIQNRDIANPLNVAFEISDLQVDAILEDGTVRNSFAASDGWTNIAALEISLTGSDTFRRIPMTRTVTGSFFPRNILSN